MSATDLPSGRVPAFASEFELRGRYDDPEDPTELTVFSPGSDRITTEWVTADRSVLVPLDGIR